MTSEHASRVKRGGHMNEQHFADAIGGRVHAGSHTGKKDVMDVQARAHSVKAGKWWQIFLYSEHRLRTNTIFQGLGNLAEIMVDCLSVYPPDFHSYKANRQAVKEALRLHMVRLKDELNKPAIFKAMLDKALFDGGNADYLSIHAGSADMLPAHKHFHIFHKDDATEALACDLVVTNSRARQTGQTSEQKVVFVSTLHGRQIGEIEDRHDSAGHYREIKCRLNGPLTLGILQAHCGDPKQVRDRVNTYGLAKRRFK